MSGPVRMIEDVVPALTKLLTKDGYVVAAMALQQAAWRDARRIKALEARLRRVCVYADDATAQATDEWGQPKRLWSPRGVWSRRRSRQENKR